MRNVVPGTHTHAAEYPEDACYATLDFGSVSVTVVPRAP